MSDNFGTPGLAINQMLEKANFHEYLCEGLKILQEGSVGIDTLLSTHIDSRLAHLNSSEGVELNLGPWKCDNCGHIIAKPEQGMLQWLTRKEDDRRVGRDLRIVHHIKVSPLDGQYGCYPNELKVREQDGSSLLDEHLHLMLGPDGLVKLLVMVDEGEFSANEISLIIMRLHVPGYEQARPYFQSALNNSIVFDDLPEGYFLQSQLRDIVANIPLLDE